jgi:hypothetical protein
METLAALAEALNQYVVRYSGRLSTLNQTQDDAMIQPYEYS